MPDFNPGDLVRVTSTGVRGTAWLSTVDKRGDYEGKDIVEAGGAMVRVVEPYRSPLEADRA